MTPEITDLIKKKAETEYQYYDENIFLDKWDYKHCCAFIDLRRVAYTSGQTEGIELMIGFTEWLLNNYTRGYNENKFCWAGLEINDRFYTITELLTKYIKEVLSK